MFPQLPVTSYTLSSLTSMCSHLHLSPSSITLRLQGMKDLLMFPQLPVTSYTLSSLTSMCSHLHVSPSSITLWLQGMSGLPQFPQLPVTQPPCLSASTSLFLYLASSNQRLIKVSTVTSYTISSLTSMCSHLHVSP